MGVIQGIDCPCRTCNRLQSLGFVGCVEVNYTVGIQGEMFVLPVHRWWKSGRKKQATMTLLELSQQYEQQAQVLRERMYEVEALRDRAPSQQRGGLTHRLHMLDTMWREARDLSVLCRRYYERGYHRNAKYTL